MFVLPLTACFHYNYPFAVTRIRTCRPFGFKFCSRPLYTEYILRHFRFRCLPTLQIIQAETLMEQLDSALATDSSRMLNPLSFTSLLVSPGILGFTRVRTRFRERFKSVSSISRHVHKQPQHSSAKPRRNG